MAGPDDAEEGFESVFKFVGGSGRFQWYACALCSFQLLVMTWNPLGYLFIGAVPNHWCHITDLEASSWTIEQIKNISIPKSLVDSQGGEAEEWKFDNCQYYDLDYKYVLEQSNGNFDQAYKLAHIDHLEKSDDKNLKECHAWEYDQSIYKSTIATDFDLVCGRRYLVATVQSTYMIGSLLGNLVTGPLSDKVLGRRLTLLISIVMVIIAGFVASISNSYIMFIGSRFIVGIGAAGSMQAAKIWLVEHCDTKSRAMFYCISNAFFGVGYAVMPIYAYYIRTWHNLQLAFSLSTLTLISYYWVFPESVRWLASQGRDDEAIQALEKIARFNKVARTPERATLLKYVRLAQENARTNEDDINEDMESIQLRQSEDNFRRKSIKNHKNGCMHEVSVTIKNYGALVSTPELRRASIVLWILFMSVAFVYYGFAFSATHVTSNLFLLVTLGGLMEVPAPVLPIPFVSRWGRRPTVIACYLGTGIFAISIAFTPKNYVATRTILYMAGKLFVSSAFTVVYLMVSEVYPTVVRSTGRGVGALMGRFGSTAAPYVADMLATVYQDLPSVIFGVVSMVVAPIALLLPEMKDKNMQDQLTKTKPEINGEGDILKALNAT